MTRRDAFRTVLVAGLLTAGGFLDGACAQPQAGTTAPETRFTRKEDVIYGRKDGLALTMDVFTPGAKANGAAVVFVISGGWFSSHDAINQGVMAEFTDRGYTVFAVVHGSQPRYTIPEILGDMHRAIRFIRYNAKQWGIDPDRIGITGGSAGGHLSLMQGMAGGPGDPNARDPVDRVSSRVQAVACFFPPTDFLNYGTPGENGFVGPRRRPELSPFRAPFDFRRLDPMTRVYVPITEDKQIQEILRAISPIYHISPDDPPTLIFQGDKDALVPLQQAQSFVDKLKEAKVPAEMVLRPGAGHGWATMADDRRAMADWFDKYLRPAAARP